MTIFAYFIPNYPSPAVTIQAAITGDITVCAYI
jgi:hypothetical protein